MGLIKEPFSDIQRERMKFRRGTVALLGGSQVGVRDI